MGIFDWLYSALMFLLLFVGTINMYIVYFTRFDPQKQELTRKFYKIGSLAILTFILLAFLLPIIN